MEMFLNLYLQSGTILLVLCNICHNWVLTDVVTGSLMNWRLLKLLFAIENNISIPLISLTLTRDPLRGRY